ncbi:MAG: hypothetical protein ACTSU6_04380 [Candidatus Njordarchaeales archaeon]
MSKKMQGPDCWNCGQDQNFQINGYRFGDRLLEDVMFTVTFENDTVEVTYPNWEKDPYMAGLNTPYWCKLIQESISNQPGDYDDSLFCVDCKEWMA